MTEFQRLLEGIAKACAEPGSAIRKALGIPEGIDFAHALGELNAANQKFAAERETFQKTVNDLTEALAEVKGRLAKREKLGTGGGMHIMRLSDGRDVIRPEASPELVEHVRNVLLESGSRGMTRVHSAGTDSEGGYLVAPEFSSEIIRLVATVGLARRAMRPVPMKSDELNVGELLTAITMYWPAENVAITPSYATFGRQQVLAKILAGLTYAPENLLEDSSPEIGQLLIDLFIEGIAGEEDNQFIAGTGSPFKGILAADNVVVKAFATGKVAFTDLTADNLLDLQTAVPDGAREGCSYFLNPTVFDYVRKLKDSTGDYIWQRPTDGAPGAIWGRPYELTEKAPALSATAANTAFIGYGNARRWAILGDRKAVAVAQSGEAGDTFAKIQRAIRVHERIGMLVYGPAFAITKTAAS